MNSTNPYRNISEIDLNKFKNITSIQYLDELLNNLPVKIAKRIPQKFSYIWSKSAMILTMGNEIYRKQDYFKYPLKEWNSADFENGLKQIVHQLKGITPEYYLTIVEPVNCFFLMETFHFELTRFYTTINDENEQVLRIDALHIIDGDEIALYFKF